MRIAALSATTGVPVATIKYYLREGLLPPGEQTSATQAQYDEDHVSRLRLIRALLEVGRLTIATTRQVLSCLGSQDLFEALGRVQRELPPAVDGDEDVASALLLVQGLGWRIEPDSTALRQLSVALRAAEDVGLPLGPDRIDAYAEAALLVAEQEVAGVPQSSLPDALTYAVIGTVLYEPILLALRRLAHQHASARRFRA